MLQMLQELAWWGDIYKTENRGYPILEFFFSFLMRLRKYTEVFDRFDPGFDHTIFCCIYCVWMIPTLNLLSLYWTLFEHFGGKE